MGMRAVTVLGAVLLLAAAKSEPVDLSKHFAGTRERCFVLLDLKAGTALRYNAEQCAKRLPPCSTFKIPNSMIGLETGVIRDLDHVFRWDGKKRWREAWNQDQT